MSEKSQSNLIRLARADGKKATITPLVLGMRVRELRKARNWTLAMAAQKVGLARSTLSKIENQQMSPTFDAVKKLAEGLEISIPQLFAPPKSGYALGRMAVTRLGKGRPHLTGTYEHEMLVATLSHKRMLPYRTRVRARDVAEFDGWVRHDGEEFLYILSGIITLFTEFYEPFEMRSGDSAYYDAEMGHNIVSKSQEDAVILWVSSLC